MLQLRNDTELSIGVTIDSNHPLVLLQVLTRVGKILLLDQQHDAPPPPRGPPSSAAMINVFRSSDR